MKNNPDVMFIQFTKDKGLTFYNAGDERFAVRSPTHNDDRYLRQEGKTRPVLSMMPRPFVSGHRRMFSGCDSVDLDGGIVPQKEGFGILKLRSETIHHTMQAMRKLFLAFVVTMKRMVLLPEICSLGIFVVIVC